MAAKYKIQKAGPLMSPAFFMAAIAATMLGGCERPPPAYVQHILWFFGHPEVFLPLAAIIMGPIIYCLIKRFGPPRGPIGIWLTGGAVALILVIVITEITRSNLRSSLLSDTHYATAQYYLWRPFIGVFFIVPVLIHAFTRLIKITYSRVIAYVQFGLFSLGTALILIAQTKVGLQPLSRYSDSANNYALLDMCTALGAIFIAMSFATFIILIIEALIRKRPLSE